MDSNILPMLQEEVTEEEDVLEDFLFLLLEDAADAECRGHYCDRRSCSSKIRRPSLFRTAFYNLDSV